MSKSGTPNEFLVRQVPPSHRGDEKLYRAIKFSLIVHVGLILILFLKSIVMPEPLNTKEYIPSLRVDLVALPDQKINETVVPSLPTEEAKPEPVKETAKEPVKEKGDYSLSKKKLKEKEAALEKIREKERKERMKNSLDRIKALDKIKAQEKTGALIHGNKVMKGSSSKGEARDAETTYHDVVLEKVRAEWELPQWLQEQGLSAKVLIKIDRTGRVVKSEFIRSSGNAQFDSHVKRAIMASSPFPVPPISVLAEVSGSGILLGFPL